MNKINYIIDNLKNKVPQAINRFNDGEMNAITGEGKISRGQQPYYDLLAKKLIEALQHEQENYWVGLPCSKCWPVHYKKVKKYINPVYKYLTHSVVLINRNYELFRSEFLKVLPDYEFYYICGRDQTIPKLEEHLKIPINAIRINTIDAWQDYDRLKDKIFPKGSLVCLSCGATGRVLVYEWFKNNPDSTFIDLGSFFDPVTREISYRYHKGILPKCKECN